MTITYSAYLSISAKTVSQNSGLNEVETTKPAVHFHLTQKIPNAHSSVRVPCK